MKTPITALALLGTLAACPAWAQTGAPAPTGPEPKSPFFTPVPADATQVSGTGGPSRIFPNASSLPEPTPADELKAPTMELPNDPIEPWLLKKDNGPFMVLAKTFRGPDCERLALALAKELRGKYGLPAYILRSKDFPGRSNIRQVPPTAEPGVVQANIAVPEKYRTYDEAAVLVGNEKTEKDSALLLHQVKKIKPDCLNSMPSMFKWRVGLDKALRTTNPYVAAHTLYPRKSDRLVVQMNQTSRSIANCPGRFSLQVAEFTGRSTFNDKDERFQGILNLKRSPLATAAEDAEHLADRLAKDPDLQKLGQPIYVYHDRTASRVYIGSFNAWQDPAAVAVRESLLKLAVPMLDRKRSTGGLDTMIVPAGMLTDLTDIKAKFL
jgi:hypothetical protein